MPCRVVGIVENFRKEERLVTNVLNTNGYSEHIIMLAQQPKRRLQEEKTPKYTICLPHVSGLSKDLREEYVESLASGQHSSRPPHTRKKLSKVKDVDPVISRAGLQGSL